MNCFFNKAILGITLAFSLPVLADDAEALKTQLARVQSLKANFEQTVTDINDKVIQQGTGLFALQYPNQFYWHLLQPDESLIVADGKDVWIYNPFAEEVTVMGFNDAIMASPIALLVNQDDDTWSQYQVSETLSKPETSESAETRCYLIKPNAERKQTTTDASDTQVSVCFNGQSLTEFSILDEQGNHSRFSLSNQTGVSSEQTDLFQFVIPEDVDIDDQRITPES